MKWLNSKKNENENEKKIFKLKKQNEIKLEDIICNIYIYLLNFSSYNYQFCFC